MKKKLKFIIPAVIVILIIVGVLGGESEPQHTLEFVKGELVTMEDGRELVGVFCNYTNMSDETYFPCDAINVRAFQHGVEIPVMVYTGAKTEGAIQCDTAVQPGTTTYVVYTFQREDNSTVSVEFTDGQKFSFELVGD